MRKVNSVYIIAGERSGDMIGSSMMLEMKKINSKVKFFGVGGPAMESAGLTSLFQMSRISLMGIFEILPHIFELKRLIRQTIDDIKAKKPDVVVTIDSPGFCYRIAKILRKEWPDVRLIHVVAPSVWVYKPSRAKKFAEVYDHLLTLLPFEPQYFEKEGLKSTYIGHPVFEQNFTSGKKSRSNSSSSNDETVILVTPGSRNGEVKRHMVVFVEALNRLAKIRRFNASFLVPADIASQLDIYLKEANFKYTIVDSKDKLKAYGAADLALAKSGTNTLEIAASGTPMIVAYKMNFLTGMIIKLTAKVKYASLINIVGAREILPEFLQSECNATSLSSALRDMIDNPEIREKQVRDATEVLKSMGLGAETKPSVIAANVIMSS